MSDKPTFDEVKSMSRAARAKVCTLGVHPESMVGCTCLAYRAQQCCDRLECRLHKCGPRVGCRCPLPDPPSGVPTEGL